ncbi:Zn-ribbon domain-containing OB-fold protein [Halomarina oriensis]|uniref:Nucleic acid-binding protein n=1 Tax=Halomarina oriensis TaxID=671145 RepID=A0A6B0GNT7_9EURY|nr:OB-fold domain-containing protein [Halomarina oriensis]MWG33258.1 nucleic acid-binding protein [Halomarina oriensis]
MSADDAPREDGFDDLLDAVEDGSGYYCSCENGHGSLPPRRVCPHCGSQALTETSLPDSGRVETFTVVRVATPQFADDVPYVTAVADFGEVRLTGIVDAAPDEVSVGMTVGVSVGRSETTGDRVLTLDPR